MRIYTEKVCDRCCRYTHHIDFPCCLRCSGMVRCKECDTDYHHKRWPCCFSCRKRQAARQGQLTPRF